MTSPANGDRSNGTTWTARCPDDGQIEVRHPIGFRERSRCELELRVLLGGQDGGVCTVVVEEYADEVRVRVFVHVDGAEEGEDRDLPYTSCPVRVWLDEPLGERAVIDVDTDEELPLFMLWTDDDGQLRTDYVPVTRRKSSKAGAGRPLRPLRHWSR
jgi:hypothetical protein